MRLSESILIGSVVVKAKPGISYCNKEGSGCAIGMAVVGAGGRWRPWTPGSSRTSRTFALQSWWPWTANLAPLPCGCRFIPGIEAAGKKPPAWKRWFRPRKLPIKEIIPHLFDQHVFGKQDWSLEQLARWVAGIEPEERIAGLRLDEPSPGATPKSSREAPPRTRPFVDPEVCHRLAERLLLHMRKHMRESAGLLLLVSLCSLHTFSQTSTQFGADAKRAANPTYTFDHALTHEARWHRRTIPLEGAGRGLNELDLTLTVSATGDVVDATAKGKPTAMKFWPKVKNEVRQWKFMPFEKNGKPVTAQVEEFVFIVSPVRPPIDEAAPAIRPDSRVAITLTRTMCYGPCPAYKVTVSTEGIVFNGKVFVVVLGRHTDRVDPNEVRRLAESFVADGFYSLRSNYEIQTTDLPSTELSIAIDGKTKQVRDYGGLEAGMPAVARGLQYDVDLFARTGRWVMGSEGLVPALRGENFRFHSYEAQLIVKVAASGGLAATVRELLQAGVPIKPLARPRPNDPETVARFEGVGWLLAAAVHPEALQALIDAGASKNDQSDKDMALASAVHSGNLAAVQVLIRYGANPDADLSKAEITLSFDFMSHSTEGKVSRLFDALNNPEVLHELLRHHPKLETRDHGRTALFTAATNSPIQAESVRLLAEAGADVNARDEHGNTALHRASAPEMVAELLKLGADVNARNNEDETPVFTTTNLANIPLLIEHGADLTIRNFQGETVMDVAKREGPARQEALRKATEKLKQP